MRNLEKDAVEMAARRQKMLQSGFELFSSRAIEPVTMQQVADACGVGIATLYRYFPTKLDLVVAISAEQWKIIFAGLLEECAATKIDEKTAAEQFEFYLDRFIDLYEHHAALLRFNYDFNYYIANAHVTREQLSANSDVVVSFSKRFHNIWVKAQADGTVRTDVGETELFASSMHIMLAVATRFAAGQIYREASSEDDVRELKTLKKMIMNEYVVKTPRA